MQRAKSHLYHLPLILGLNWSLSSSSSSSFSPSSFTGFSCFSSGGVMLGISLARSLFGVMRLRTTEFGINPSGAHGQ